MNREDLVIELKERIFDKAHLEYHDYDDLVECDGVDRDEITDILKDFIFVIEVDKE